MSKAEHYKFGIILNSPSRWSGNMNTKTPELAKVVLVNRLAQKICRKCYSRLPLNATVCRNCKNSDLRIRKYRATTEFYLDKNSKNRITDKRKNIKSN